MTSLPVLDELPAGYFVEESPRGILVVHADVARLLHEAGFGPESDGTLVQSELVGRKPLFEIHAGEESFVVRRFSHGGLARWLTRDRFLDPERPFRELILSDSLRRVGIPTPQVVAARAQSLAGGGWQLELMTRRATRSLDLGFVLTKLQRGEVPREARSRLLVAVGALVRRLHAHGCIHGDLNPNNILVAEDVLEGAEPEPWILDLDRSYFVKRLSDSERRANLRRLFRHVRKRESRESVALKATDYARFFRGYDPEGQRWKADLRAVLLRHSLAKVLHDVGWLLERPFVRKDSNPRVPAA